MRNPPLLPSSGATCRSSNSVLSSTGFTYAEAEYFFYNFSTKDIQALTEGLIEDARRWRTLTLSQCQLHNITDQTMKAFAEALARSNLLVALDLGYTHLNPDILTLLSRALAENHSLKTLTLHIDNASCTEAIAILLENNQTITSLDLTSINEISTNTLVPIARSLPRNTSLTHLGFIGSNIRKMKHSEVEAIVMLLENNPKITSLDLSFNGIDTDAIAPIVSFLSNNTSLTHLNLCNHRLNQKAIREILNALTANPNTNLSKLDLSFHKQNTSRAMPCDPLTITALVNLLSKNQSLTIIDIALELNNKSHITLLAEAMKNSKNLLHFNLYNTNFASEEAGYFNRLFSENAKAAKSLLLELKSYLKTNFENLNDEMVSKISERKAALNAALEKELNDLPKNQKPSDQRIKEIKTLINHSQNIKKSWDGYRAHPLRQLGIAKIPNPNTALSPAVTGFYDLPLDLHKHIFSYLPLPSFAHPPAKNYIATPDTAAMPSKPTIGAASQIEKNQQASSQPAQTSLFSKFVTRIKNFFMDLFHCLFPCASTKNASKEISKQKEEHASTAHAHQPNPITTPSTSRNQTPVGYFSGKLKAKNQSAAIQGLS